MFVAFTLGLLLQAGPASVIAGKVMSSVTGAPLRKATVTLKSGKVDRATASDAEGRFRFEGVPPGQYRLKTVRQGFLPDESQFEVSLGESATDVELSLTPQAVLAGRVVDEDGDPVPETDVDFQRVSKGKRPRFLESGGMQTDAEGHFLITELQAGRYYLKAASKTLAVASGKEAYVETFYPNGLDMDSALPLDLNAGVELRNLEIRLRRAQTSAVRGRITGAGAIERVNLVMMPDHRNPHPGPQSYSAQARNGAFEFNGVRPGSYVIYAGQTYDHDQQTGDYRRIPLSCFYPVAISGDDLENLVLQLKAGIQLTGRIKLDGPARNVSLSLMPLGAPVPNFPITVREDGTLQISKLPADFYRLSIAPAKGDYVSSIRFAGHEVKERTLDLTSGAGGLLEISISHHAAEVTAKVKDKDKTVAMWSTDGSDSSFMQTNERGEAVFGNLGPGEYRIAAWEDAGMAPDSEPASLAEWNEAAIKVEVGGRRAQDGRDSSHPTGIESAPRTLCRGSPSRGEVSLTSRRVIAVFVFAAAVLRAGTPNASITGSDH